VKSDGGTQKQMIASIFGTVIICSSVEIVFSRFVPFLKRIITPLVSGVVVLLIGFNLIKVGITDVGCGA